jgi:hypothetical protein
MSSKCIGVCDVTSYVTRTMSSLKHIIKEKMAKMDAHLEVSSYVVSFSPKTKVKKGTRREVIRCFSFTSRCSVREPLIEQCMRARRHLAYNRGRREVGTNADLVQYVLLDVLDPVAFYSLYNDRGAIVSYSNSVNVLYTIDSIDRFINKSWASHVG